MTPIDFVTKIKQVVCDSAVRGCLLLLHQPPGRKPPPHLLALSKWFKSLSDIDKENIRATIELAAKQCTFGWLAVLDGVRQLDDSADKGKLELHYSRGDQSDLLNNPSAESLHDLFCRLNTAEQLRDSDEDGDGRDTEKS